MVTPSHEPPTTVSGRSTHSVNTLPTILQPSSVASKNETRRKSHPTNAVAACVEALNRPPWKVHDSKVAPDVLASERSTSVKVQSVNRAAPRSSPYQSSPRRCCPVTSIGSPTAATLATAGDSRGSGTTSQARKPRSSAADPARCSSTAAAATSA